MSFTIELYKCSAERNRVDKTNYLIKVDTVNCTLKNDISISNPILLLEGNDKGDWLGFNYVYIPSFSRYYFVDDIIAGITTLWEAHLTIDALFTYKDAIKSCSGYVERNENEFNKFIVDSKQVYINSVNHDITVIPNNLFSSDVSYLLTGYITWGNN